MAFKSIGGQCEYIGYNKGQKKNGDVLLIGTFIESKHGKYTLDHYFHAADDNRKLCINGNGHLDYLMTDIKPGWEVQVTYLGEETLTKGTYEGKMSHQFDVAVDEKYLGVDPETAAVAEDEKDFSLASLM